MVQKRKIFFQKFIKKINEDPDEIRDAIRQGHIAYVINTSDIASRGQESDGRQIRAFATESNVTIFTALDTVRVLLDVLEETTLTISTIDANYNIFTTDIVGNRFDVTLFNTVVNSGNFKVVLIYNDEIVHEFRLNELMQTYTLENPHGAVSLRIAGESADFEFSYSTD